MKVINIKKKDEIKFAYVDDIDFDKVKDLNWQFGSGGYAVVTIQKNRIRKHIWMHRLIMNDPKGYIVDHINGNGFDNRRSNLRLSTQRQNICNQRLHKNNTTGMKGVTWFKRIKKWHAKITVNYKSIHLGYFDDIKKAAIAYNLAALKYQGVFSKLNKI